MATDDLTAEELASLRKTAPKGHYLDRAVRELQRLRAQTCGTCQHTRISLASARRECAFNSGAWGKNESCSRWAPKPGEGEGEK